MILEVESDWRDTGIPCRIGCGVNYYTDGVDRPMCPVCLEEVTDAEVWQWLTLDHSEAAHAA
jgi:hypothetical protein